MSSKVNNKDFWNERYKEENTPWDIGEVAPAFVKYFSSLKPLPLSIAVLGCGHGHDAFYIVNKGYKVIAFDFSESAINHCNQVKEKEHIKNIDFYQADIFELIKDKKWQDHFDIVLEHTCFCAIDPSRRNDYLKLIKYLLKPGGKLIGLFFMRDKELGGPPYGSTPEEIKKFFKEDLKEVVELHPEPCLHSNHKAEEWFGIFKKATS